MLNRTCFEDYCCYEDHCDYDAKDRKDKSLLAIEPINLYLVVPLLIMAVMLIAAIYASGSVGSEIDTDAILFGTQF